MTAQPLAPAPALPDGAANGNWFGWLTPAVKDAASASGNWPLTLAPATEGRTCSPRVVTITPGMQEGAIREARDFAIAILRRWGVAERCGDIAVVLSELLTNAVRHSLSGPREVREPREAEPGQAVRLGLIQPGQWVQCAVFDPSHRPPVPQDPDPLAEGGRGLHVVEALSDSWGCARLPGQGKIVWAMFSAKSGQA